MPTRMSIPRTASRRKRTATDLDARTMLRTGDAADDDAADDDAADDDAGRWRCQQMAPMRWRPMTSTRHRRPSSMWPIETPRSTRRSGRRHRIGLGRTAPAPSGPSDLTSDRMRVRPVAVPCREQTRGRRRTDVDGTSGRCRPDRVVGGRSSATICRPRGCGSVGRASPCQGEGRRFDPGHPLHDGLGVSPGSSSFSAEVGDRTSCQSGVDGLGSGLRTLALSAPRKDFRWQQTRY